MPFQLNWNSHLFIDHMSQNSGPGAGARWSQNIFKKKTFLGVSGRGLSDVGEKVAEKFENFQVRFGSAFKVIPDLDSDPI